MISCVAPPRPRAAISAEVWAELLESAALAPSPDNNQPWRLRIQNERLWIFPDEARGLPSDANSLFMHLALGAAAENVCIAARNYEYEAQAFWRCAAPASLPDLDAPAATAAAVEMQFTKGAKADPLFEHLRERCSCRKAYRPQPLSLDCLQDLTQSIDAFEGVGIEWLVDRVQLGGFATLVGACDRLRFEHRPFHEELFKQLRFTVADAQATRDGLDIRTLELPWGGTRMLKSLRSWRRMQLVHKLGLGRLLAAPAAAAVRKSGAVALLTVASPSPEEHLEAGRAMQRLWLTAHSLGLSVQPLGSLPIFLAHLHSGAAALAPAHRLQLKGVQDSYARLVPGIAERVLVMAMRIGRSAPPRHRSLRRRVEDLLA